MLPLHRLVYVICATGRDPCHAHVDVSSGTSTSSVMICFIEENQLFELLEGSDPWIFRSCMNQLHGYQKASGIFSFNSPLINTSHEKCQCDA